MARFLDHFRATYEPRPLATVTLCAWCQKYGQPTTQARPIDQPQAWAPISHEEAARLWSSASHGACPACCAILRAEVRR